MQVSHPLPAPMAVVYSRWTCTSTVRSEAVLAVKSAVSLQYVTSCTVRCSAAQPRAWQQWRAASRQPCGSRGGDRIRRRTGGRQLGQLEP